MMNNYLNEKEVRGGCCGRPMQYTTEPKCNWTCGPVSEYCGHTLGRIKKDADPCKSCAIIPALTVETTDGITNLANCFVHVTSINTTFYIDDKHRPMIIWSGDVGFTANTESEMLNNVLGLRSQYAIVDVTPFASDTTNKQVIYYDKTGKPFWCYEMQPMQPMEEGDTGL